MREVVSLNVTSFLNSYHAIMRANSQMGMIEDVVVSEEYGGFVTSLDATVSPIFSYLQYVGYREQMVNVPSELVPYLELIKKFEVPITGKRHIEFKKIRVEDEKELA